MAFIFALASRSISSSYILMLKFSQKSTKSSEKNSSPLLKLYMVHKFSEIFLTSFVFLNFFFFLFSFFNILLIQKIQLNLWQFIQRTYSIQMITVLFLKGVQLPKINNKFSDFNLIYKYLTQKCKLHINKGTELIILRKLRNK